MFCLIKKIINYFKSCPGLIKFFWLALLLLWLAILTLAIRPFGSAKYTVNNFKGNYFIHKLSPPERWASSTDDLIMIGQPTYFFLRPSRPFNQAEIKLTWRQRQTPTYLEAGVLLDKANWQYRMIPLANSALDQLTWSVIEQDGYRLWQKKTEYKSWEQFLTKLPSTDQLAVYYWSPTSTKNIVKADYVAAADWQEIPGRWRGPQQLSLYLGAEEKLNWRLTASNDSNEQLKNDEKKIEINIWDNQGQRLWTETRQILDNQLSFDITAGPWPAGAYRLEIKASSRIVFEMSTKQTVFAWQGQVWPVGQAGQTWQIWTDVPEVIAQTI
ncbi:MAG TPA: hypothetical protein PKN62_01770, partial [bacterium]|nr:hypothetical protein [bacterium]